MKLVSIIVPVYNAEKYIEECIDSLMGQTYKEIEIILVDDGSTDNSLKILKSLEKKDSRILVITQKNQGAPKARNAGIEAAKGQYVMFFDSDDILNNNAIEILMKNIHEADLIIGNYCEIDESGKITRDNQEYNKIDTYIGERIYELSCKNPIPGNKLYKKELIDEFQIRFSSVKIGQDLSFFLKYINHAKKVEIITNQIFKYRIINNSISRTYSFKIFDIIKVFKEINQYYATYGATEFYNRYISVAQLIHYNGQMSKLTRFKEKIDRKIIVLVFKKYEKEIEYDKGKFFKENKKFYNRFKMKQLFSVIFISNIGCALYNVLYRMREKMNIKKF